LARNEIPFSLDPLDTRLVLAKPLHKIETAVAHALEAKGHLAITRKRDGHRHPLVVSGNQRSSVRLYTRTMNEVTEKFPHLVRRSRRRFFRSTARVLCGQDVVSSCCRSEVRKTLRFTCVALPAISA